MHSPGCTVTHLPTLHPSLLDNVSVSLYYYTKPQHTDSEEIMVSIKNLTFAFKKGVPVLSGLNMDFQPGRTYGLFGLNGAGKTTLLNQISGMLFPAEGECLINQKPVRERLPETMSSIFVVPEQFELPSLKPAEFVDLHAPFYPDFDTDQITSLMEQFTLDQEKRLSEQSYGQRKKFLISFALAANTDVLLMDEPTNGLDIPSKSQFRKIMAGTNREDRCTLISTHQVRDLDTLIDRVTVLHRGVIIFDYTIEEISQNLTFRKTEDTNLSDRIYGEPILGGENAIFKRQADDDDTLIDLELLFNATIEENQNLVNAMVNGGLS
jgi:ABC-2 type transport system ATP-binding protein